MSDSERPQPWTIASLLKWATDDFRSKGIDSPRLDAEVLLGHATGLSRVQLIMDANKPLMPPELAAFRELVKRRRLREPVAYLLGVREFYGRSFKVDKRVLVPRPETEILVEIALQRTTHCSLSMRALDLCTGSGCVAISLARERPTSFVYGTDISKDALAVARENAYRLGATNTSFWESDLFAVLEPARPRFDIITANPPYIATDEVATLDADVRVYEPRLALDGGKDGLDFVRRIASRARAHLFPGGVLAMEVGAGEAPLTAEILEREGFRDVRRTPDYARIERVVHGVAPE